MLRELDMNEMAMVSGGHINGAGNPMLDSAGSSLAGLGGNDGTTAVATGTYDGPDGYGVTGTLVNTGAGSNFGFGGSGHSDFSHSFATNDYLQLGGQIYGTERAWLQAMVRAVFDDAAANTGFDIPTGIDFGGGGYDAINGASNSAMRGFLNALGAGPLPTAPTR